MTDKVKVWRIAISLIVAVNAAVTISLMSNISTVLEEISTQKKEILDVKVETGYRLDYLDDDISLVRSDLSSVKSDVNLMKKPKRSTKKLHSVSFYQKIQQWFHG